MSEHTLGARLGMDALNIELAYKAGKLSESAYNSVKSTFDARVDQMIKELDEHISHASKDPYRNKNVAYSPVQSQTVKSAIDVMLKAIDSVNFTQGLRSALSTLEDMHNAQRERQTENGTPDQRYAMPFFGLKDQTEISDKIQIKSKYFTDYLEQPQWAISGNLFSVSMFV